jgi:hypothetical protein
MFRSVIGANTIIQDPFEDPNSGMIRFGLTPSAASMIDRFGTVSLREQLNQEEVPAPPMMYPFQARLSSLGRPSQVAPAPAAPQAPRPRAAVVAPVAPPMFALPPAGAGLMGNVATPPNAAQPYVQNASQGLLFATPEMYGIARPPQLVTVSANYAPSARVLPDLGALDLNANPNAPPGSAVPALRVRGRERAPSSSSSGDTP